MELYIEIIGVIVGLLYLWFEYKASIYLWITSIIMPVVYIFVFYNAGLYADFGINVYYLLIAVYGWIKWKYGTAMRVRIHKKEGGVNENDRSLELPISKVPYRQIILLILVFIISFLVIVWILKNFTNSDVPWCDSFTTAMSIIGMWMLAQKYIEQWFVWIVVDVVSVALYIYKDLYPTASLYGLYAIIAIFGYIKWKKLMLEEGSK